MIAALTVWDGRLSPVFDVSRQALLLTIEDNCIRARTLESIATHTADRKPERLTALGVETLICGAISEPLHHELTTRGVKVIGFVAGSIDEVIKSFLAGDLPSAALSMPGCCGRRNRLRGGCKRGGRRGGGNP